MGRKAVYNPDIDKYYGYPAEMAVKESIEKQPRVLFVEHHPFDRKDIDLMVKFIDGDTVFVDVERRMNWSSSDFFPFPTVHIPLRKLEMIKSRMPFVYAVVRHDLKRVFFIDGRYILNMLSIVEVSNRIVPIGEDFIDIPMQKDCKYVYLD